MCQFTYKIGGLYLKSFAKLRVRKSATCEWYCERSLSDMRNTIRMLQECYSRQVTFSDRIWLRMRIFFRTRIVFAILVIKSSHTLINTYTTRLMRIVIVTTL
jgi:hypothetical protein